MCFPMVFRKWIITSFIHTYVCFHQTIAKYECSWRHWSGWYFLYDTILIINYLQFFHIHRTKHRQWRFYLFAELPFFAPCSSFICTSYRVIKTWRIMQRGKKGNELVEHEGSERARVKICLLSLGGFAVQETCSLFPRFLALPFPHLHDMRLAVNGIRN